MEEPTLLSFLSRQKGGFAAFEPAEAEVPEDFGDLFLRSRNAEASSSEGKEKGKPKRDPVPGKIAKELLFWVRRHMLELDQVEQRRAEEHPQGFLQLAYLACQRFHEVVEGFGLETMSFEDLRDKEIFLELQKQVRLLEGHVLENLDEGGRESIRSFLYVTNFDERLDLASKSMGGIILMEDPVEFLSFAVKQNLESLHIEDELRLMTNNDSGKPGAESYEEWCVKKDLAIGVIEAVLPVLSELIGAENTLKDPLWMPDDPLGVKEEDPLQLALKSPDWAAGELRKWVVFRDDFVGFLKTVIGDSVAS